MTSARKKKLIALMKKANQLKKDELFHTHKTYGAFMKRKNFHWHMSLIIKFWYLNFVGCVHMCVDALVEIWVGMKNIWFLIFPKMWQKTKIWIFAYLPILAWPT